VTGRKKKKDQHSFFSHCRIQLQALNGDAVLSEYRGPPTETPHPWRSSPSSFHLETVTGTISISHSSTLSFSWHRRSPLFSFVPLLVFSSFSMPRSIVLPIAPLGQVPPPPSVCFNGWVIMMVLRRTVCREAEQVGGDSKIRLWC